MIFFLFWGNSTKYSSIWSKFIAVTILETVILGVPKPSFKIIFGFIPKVVILEISTIPKDQILRGLLTNQKCYSQWICLGLLAKIVLVGNSNSQVSKIEYLSISSIFRTTWKCSFNFSNSFSKWSSLCN